MLSNKLDCDDLYYLFIVTTAECNQEDWQEEIERVKSEEVQDKRVLIIALVPEIAFIGIVVGDESIQCTKEYDEAGVAHCDTIV